MKRIILFLDIDGVFKSHRLHDFQNIETRVINKFVKTIKEFSIKIVWSTSHRILHTGNDALYGEGYKRMLKRNNLLQMSDLTHEDWRTPSVHTANRIRGDEVNLWLDNHIGEYDEFLCIDDDSDFYPNQPLFQTNSATGMTLSDITLLEKILKYMSEIPVEYNTDFDVYLRKQILLGKNLQTLLTFKNKRETWNHPL